MKADPQKWTEWLATHKPGWTVESGQFGALCLHYPTVGYVTVDFEMRNFALGSVAVRIRGGFKHRGWQESLMLCAINALEKCK